MHLECSYLGMRHTVAAFAHRAMECERLEGISFRMNLTYIYIWAHITWCFCAAKLGSGAIETNLRTLDHLDSNSDAMASGGC